MSTNQNCRNKVELDRDGLDARTHGLPGLAVTTVRTAAVTWRKASSIGPSRHSTWPSRTIRKMPWPSITGPPSTRSKAGSRRSGQIEKEQGRIKKEQGRIEKKATEDDREAMRDYEEAIRLHKEIAGAGKAQPNAVPLGTAELYDAYLNLAHTSTRQATSTGRFAIIPMPLTLPQNAPTPIAAGAVYYEIGRYDLAIDDYTKAIAFVPRSSNADEEAAEGARLARKRAEGYLGRGTAYLAKGFPDLAFGDLTEAQHLDPTSQQALWQRAIAGLKLGES